MAEIPGKYRSLPAKVSLMYYPEVYGASSDDELVIR